jgi:isopenicillin-N epimerase
MEPHMIRRRDFLAHGTVAIGALAGLPSPALAHRLHAQRSLGVWLNDTLTERGAGATPERLADDEPFWAELRRAYDLDPTVVNLDHGWTNPAPRAAMDTLFQGARALESLPAEQLVRLWEETTNTSVRQAMATAMGVPPTELAFVRNATEALNTVILGVPLREGDEIVCSAHDYYAMLDALEQRRARDGVVLRMVRPPVPAPSMDTLVDAYRAAIGPRTRLVLLTHPSNLTGQLLPVRRIAELAHAAGAEVVVDGAQSLGLLEEPVTALGCDYYGGSAHKWLGAPVGMGMLWMRPEHVAKVWPVVPPPAHVTGMARFEWIGTAPEYVGPALGPALAVHASLGAARKAARLRYLATRLRARVTAAVPQARFYTTADAAMSCGITTVALPGVDVAALQRRLRERDGILVQAMTDMARSPEIDGLRVTPNVYTTLDELDRLVAALAS